MFEYKDAIDLHELGLISKIPSTKEYDARIRHLTNGDYEEIFNKL